MGFKEQILADAAVFLNSDEFADTHNIDGAQVNCVIDTDTEDSGKNNQSMATYLQFRQIENGIYGRVITLYVKTADLPDRPVPGQHMRLDGEIHTVQACEDVDGMLQIVLEAYKA